MVTLYSPGTEYTFNSVTLLRGSVADIVSVGVAHLLDPNEVPELAAFVTVTLVDGVTTPEDPLAEAGQIDIASLIGPLDGDVVLAPGDHQRWVLLSTLKERIMRPVDVVEVL